MSVSREIGATLLAFPPLVWSQAGQALAWPPPASQPRLIPRYPNYYHLVGSRGPWSEKLSP
ncbi:hypothetical protein CGRA01v4_00999 [Colletotrichum graminicola]|nr:hypothetical protein CGRA01v4_00999 [Colletotrichum graminicola]